MSSFKIVRTKTYATVYIKLRFVAAYEMLQPASCVTAVILVHLSYFRVLWLLA